MEPKNDKKIGQARKFSYKHGVGSGDDKKSRSISRTGKVRPIQEEKMVNYNQTFKKRKVSNKPIAKILPFSKDPIV